MLERFVTRLSKGRVVKWPARLFELFVEKVEDGGGPLVDGGQLQPRVTSRFVQRRGREGGLRDMAMVRTVWTVLVVDCVVVRASLCRCICLLGVWSGKYIIFPCAAGPAQPAPMFPSYAADPFSHQRITRGLAEFLRVSSIVPFANSHHFCPLTV